jgi:hypothetical protein
MRLSKRLDDLEAKAGDVELASIADVQLTLMAMEAVDELCDLLDVTGDGPPDGLTEAVQAKDWRRTIRILEGMECAA